MTISNEERSDKRVVGDVVRELRKIYGTTPEAAKSFAYGFCAGQAEKVYLGACQAAMFRPSPEHLDWYLTEVRVIAAHFGLTVTLLDSHCPKTPTEIWIHKGKIGEWLQHEVNSPDWHRLRAAACGIADVDTEYHLRCNYGEKCD
jgi:hypothetical protein